MFDSDYGLSVSGFNYLQLIFVNVYAVHKMEFLPVIPKSVKALDDVFTVFCLRVFFVSGPSATWTWYPAIFPAIASRHFSRVLSESVKEA